MVKPQEFCGFRFVISLPSGWSSGSLELIMKEKAETSFKKNDAGEVEYETLFRITKNKKFSIEGKGLKIFHIVVTMAILFSIVIVFLLIPKALKLLNT